MSACDPWDGPWHRWFAWRPVWTVYGWTWLRVVERRFVWKPYLSHPVLWLQVQYRMPVGAEPQREMAV